MKPTSLLIPLLAFAGCVSDPPVSMEMPVPPQMNLWQGWAGEIATLKKPGTPKAAWDEKSSSGSAKQINSKAELRSILERYEDLSENERKRYLALYSEAVRTMHYGFEGDFRALVFYDSYGRTLDAFLMGS